MKEFYKFDSAPEGSLVMKGLGSIDYCDSYMVIKDTDDSVDEITGRIFTLPGWIQALLKIRQVFIVRLFGLKTGDHEIPVIEKNEHEVVVGEDDKHLYFRISVMKKQAPRGTGIYLTTIVKFNNLLGKIYFFFIKPFHKQVVKSLLKKV
ncbi:MAG TPA: DUF2867 domain-containing protein [Spirochaetota bacterium]|nr:DUF2867 domain-containing protein [Spirochaetota bacterium]HPI88937.1 DUF2867 domain-containing protein [Spirochaetota bacterium]HPR46586.1 DUF2867 domain-containing protein [Spirochaetota bacterium]